MALVDTTLTSPRTLAMEPVSTQAEAFSNITAVSPGYTNGKLLSYVAPDFNLQNVVVKSPPTRGIASIPPLAPSPDDWSAADAYSAGATVSDSGTYWVANEDVPSGEPAPSAGSGVSNPWRVLATEWVDGTSAPGVYWHLRAGGGGTIDAFYTALSNETEPPDSATNATGWEYLYSVNSFATLFFIQAFPGEPYWDSGNTYYPGDVVSYYDDTNGSLPLFVATGKIDAISPLAEGGSFYWKPFTSGALDAITTAIGSGINVVGENALSLALSAGYGFALTPSTLDKSIDLTLAPQTVFIADFVVLTTSGFSPATVVGAGYQYTSGGFDYLYSALQSVTVLPTPGASDANYNYLGVNGKVVSVALAPSSMFLVSSYTPASTVFLLNSGVIVPCPRHFSIVPTSGSAEITYIGAGPTAGECWAFTVLHCV